MKTTVLGSLHRYRCHPEAHLIYRGVSCGVLDTPRAPADISTPLLRVDRSSTRTLLHPRTGRAHFVLMVMLASVFCTGVTNRAIGQQVDQQAFADSILDAAVRHHAQRDSCERELAELRGQVKSLEQSSLYEKEWVLSIRASKPVLEDTWTRLEIGEFESQADFARRQAAAKQRAQRDFEAAEHKWKARLSKEERRVAALLTEREATAKRQSAEVESLIHRTAASQFVLPALPSHRRTLASKQISLPRFDRASMSFGPIVVPPSGVIELRSSRPGNLVARIEESSPTAFRVKLPSLEAAKIFRERFEAGDINCVVVGGLDLSPDSPESPILVQPEIVKTEESVSKPHLILGLIGAVGMALRGASAEEHQSMPEPPMVLETVVVQREIKEAGTRYHFAMSPDTVLLLDRSGKPVKDATVSILGEPVRVKAVLWDAQPGARVLQPGDRIFGVGDREIRDTRAFRSATRSFAAGQSYEVIYRRAGSKVDLRFTAQGGKPVGIELE